MISDILAQAVGDLNHYLNDSFWDRTYNGALRERIIRLRDDAHDIQVLLDAEPRDTHDKEATDTNPAQDDRSKRRKPLAWLMSEESARRPPFFSQKDLLKRGWSKGLIAQLLGEPDWKSPNPHVAGAAPMLCWREDRVLATEDTPAFKELRREVRNSRDVARAYSREG